MLTRLTGLSDRVSFRHGSALDMPFPAENFDAVWTPHSSMNINDFGAGQKRYHLAEKNDTTPNT
jgi:ubiquinone/menaquinone biosynthesis C-methylase UbiE